MSPSIGGGPGGGGGGGKESDSEEPALFFPDGGPPGGGAGAFVGGGGEGEEVGDLDEPVDLLDFPPGELLPDLGLPSDLMERGEIEFDFVLV